MKFLKKRSVAVTVMILCVVLALGIGRLKAPDGPASSPDLSVGLDESLDTAYYGQFIYDSAGVLDSSAEQTLALYNANWDARYESITAFVSVFNVSIDAEDYAYNMADDFGLREGDALLLVVKDSDTYRFIWGGGFDQIINAKTGDQLASAMDGGSWEDDVLGFYATLNQILVANFGEGNGTAGQNHSGGVYGSSGGMGLASALVTLVILAVIIILLLSAVERSRFNAYRRQYYGVVNPPVVFRPIFFWHGPGSAWYRRSWNPPPPPPPRGPGGFGGPGGGFGGSRPGGGSRPTGSSSGFGGAGNRGPRGSGFSGGGSFGGPRGSSFGGSRGGSSFGGSRGGGSFGGSRGGGSFGGSRGGGSFGGSRGGGFGGRR